MVFLIDKAVGERNDKAHRYFKPAKPIVCENFLFEPHYFVALLKKC